MIEDLKQWLSEPCKDSDVRFLEPDSQDPDNRAAYIPIGIIENTLDEFDSWDVYGFTGTLDKASNYWFYDASATLEVKFNQVSIKKTGAVTFQISSRDKNMDFAATALSFCIANAAKKLGKKFGRHLNGRLDKGETGVAIIRTQKEFEPETINEEFEQVLLKLNEIQYKEDAEEYIKTTGFQYFIPAKNAINSKQNKPLNDGSIS